MKNSSKGRILLADKNQSSSAAIKAVLSKAGYNVIILPETNNILPALTEINPQLFLLDRDFPDSHVSDLISEIRNTENLSNIFIVLISSSECNSSLPEKISGVPDGFLFTPLKEEFLVAIVDSFMKHKTALDHLRSSEDSFTKIVQQNPDGIIIIDPEGIVRFSNEKADSMFGRAEQSITGTLFGSPVIIDDNSELSITISGSGTRYIEMSAVGIRWKNQPMTLLSLRDITEKKIIEERLQRLTGELEIKVEERTEELNKQVQKLNRSQKAMLYMVEDLNELTGELKEERRKLQMMITELESFSYSVSHDLRAPLRAIDGYSSILLEDYSHAFDSEGSRMLNTLRENAQKMDKLITDLLTLSRVSRSEMKMVPVDMSAMALSVFNDLHDNNNGGDVKLVLNELEKINADPVLMRQVWENLLSNALKYSRPKKERIIEVGSFRQNNSNTYFVRDNGVGFNPIYATKLFETFHRLHSNLEFEGTGVGLSIVQRVLNRHGGKVWAEGVEGEGATFWFSIPVLFVNPEKDESQLIGT